MGHLRDFVVAVFGTQLRVGAGLIIVGILLFISGQDIVSQYQTGSGTLARTVSEQDQQTYQTGQLLRIFGPAVSLVGFFMVWRDYQHKHHWVWSKLGIDNQSGKKVTSTVFKTQTIDPGSYTSFNINIEEPSVLDYKITVLKGSDINVIVTSGKYLDEFDKSAKTKHKSDASKFSVSEVRNKSRLPSGNWVLILDNTGRLEPNEVPEETDIEIEYELYQ